MLAIQNRTVLPMMIWTLMILMKLIQVSAAALLKSRFKITRSIQICSGDMYYTFGANCLFGRLSSSNSKQVTNHKTYTQVIPLSKEAQTKEIARMIGGEAITPLLLQNAQEMIDSAKQLKV